MPIEYRITIFGDFNLDEMLSENVANVEPLTQSFNLSQCIQYLIYVHADY